MAEQAELSEAAIAALKQKHGDRLSAVKAPDGTTLVVQRPTKAIWTLFTNDVSKDDIDRAAIIERLVLDCTVHPPRGEAKTVLDEFPAFAATLSSELSKMAGATDRLDAKKL